MKQQSRNGKGSKRRPTNESAYRDNFDSIFVSLIESRPFDNEPIEHADSRKKSNFDFESDALIQSAMKLGNLLS
jgi:hypothetical protein